MYLVGAASYICKLVGENSKRLVSTLSPNITFDDLVEGTFYNFSVKSISESNKSTNYFSDVIVFQTGEK